MGLDNPIHIAFLLIMLLLVFGAKRLPEMGHSLGTGMRGFKNALSGEGGAEPSLSAVQHQQQSAAAAPVAVPVPVAIQAPVATTTPVDEQRQPRTAA
jgi:sec-independent protein translocase protein TatA